MIEATHIVLTALPFLFGGLALVILTVAFWSARWPSVKGTIEVSGFAEEWEADSSGNSTTIEKKGKHYLAYAYTVAGITYHGARIAPLVEFSWQVSGSPTLSSAHDEAQWYREGAIVDVYYCPYSARWACLEPGGFIWAGLFSCAAALMLLFR